ncbi:MAG TPA: hypothetical protein VF660_07105 [Actinomycetota bacterium]|jgi:hypothetical protein
MKVVEVVIAAILILLGVRSLLHWLRTHFDAATTGEHLLFAVHVTARVGVWLALGAAFLGYALVDRPQDLTWFVVVPLILAGTQLLTAIVLGRQPSRPSPKETDAE